MNGLNVMAWIELSIAVVVGLATSIGLITLILQASWFRCLADRPSESHHTHKTPISRLGGIALAGAMVAVVLVFSFLVGPGMLLKDDLWLVIPTSLAMFGLGLWDDLRALGARRKLLGQILIASVAFFCGIDIAHFKLPFFNQIIDLGIWAWPVTVFWLIAMTNLINLIDGVDGLAGGISLMLMILLVYVSMQAGSVPFIAAGMLGALVGFLRFNFPPARIYMGDGGAYFLGCLIGCLTIVTSQKGTIFAALAAPLFVLALPIIDTSIAIARRGFRGLPLFRPDRKHIHHRLLASGHSRRTVVLGLYAFTAFFLVLGFASFCWHGQYFSLFLGIGTLTIILVAGKFDFSREWLSLGRVLGNSMETRAEIQYAISLSRWLALEGARAPTVESLAEDAVFIARKLGFESVRIKLNNQEKNWPLLDSSESCHSYRHELPGDQDCFIELNISCRDSNRTEDANRCKKCRCTSDISADLLAEGWAKAVGDWQKCHRRPVRFQAQMIGKL